MKSAAEGTRAMNEAQNLLTIEARGSLARLRLIDRLEGIIREQVKPLENIESIKILHVDGLGGGGHGGASGDFNGGAGVLRPGRQLGSTLSRPSAVGR